MAKNFNIYQKILNKIKKYNIKLEKNSIKTK